MKSLNEIENVVGKPFPEDYREFLEGHPQAASTEEMRGGDGVTFYLYRERGKSAHHSLFGRREIDDHVAESWRILSAYVEGMREDDMEDVHIVGTRRRAAGKSLDWLASRIAIGDGNGDVVFFDQDDWSIWVFYHDGCEVERLADSFSELEVVEG
jgi:hypothetical protein